ncbi:hypothetical protein QNH23_00385 [Siminovitchia fortis]|uniref:Uncharacterized protein n=1 Tax=Siminovitchia fortis TaxID=254758 RepID=A0A443IZN3_9BACI|nr:hypothetical protein [Siminovitchia fortis]RWR13616.1 hypothetical protein D4N35_004150 [Siminovitchia fortis]WHY81924.1 hypothetical protein QNH23_00385 [Siminovitchia fortis]
MESKPTQDKIDRAKALKERNEKGKAFYNDKVKQAQRDQLVMPVDDVSDELVEKREEFEDDKHASYGPRDLKDE